MNLETHTFEKQCSRCTKIKSVDDFYRDSRVKSGLTADCKDCRKMVVTTRSKLLRETNPEWVDKERRRGREKHVRLNYAVKVKNRAVEQKANGTFKSSAERHKEYRANNPEKNKAHKAIRNLQPKQGVHRHHWSYNEEHVKDFIEMTLQQHRRLHTVLIYDEPTLMYRVKATGILLDTREKHYEFFKSTI